MRKMLSLFVVFLAACGTERGDSARTGSTEAEAWTLSLEPTLSIGVLEGDDAYQLHVATSSRRLSDGRIAVVNGGTSEVRFFSAEGEYIGAFGGEGSGPGEFRQATHLHLAEDDRLRVWDQRLLRYSFHRTDGTHLSVEGLQFDTSVEPYPADVWYYRRHLIDSPVSATSRAPIAAAVAKLPAFDSTRAVRYVWVTEQGRLWTSEEELPADTPVEISVWSLEGEPVATVTVPAQFELHDIGPDYLLGRWFDDLDVNYVREYSIDKPAGSARGPGLSELRALEDASVEYVVGEVPAETSVALASLFKNMASKQEINYSTAMSYTADLGQLEMEIPTGIRVDFIEATPRGWTGVVTDTATGAHCVLSYGNNTPMGWQGGRLICPGAAKKDGAAKKGGAKPGAKPGGGKS